MKHTEGPWRVRDCAAYWFEILTSDWEMVLAENIKDEADARLMAKAPEMAALLRKHLGWHRASGMPTQETEALLAELEEYDS